MGKAVRILIRGRYASCGFPQEDCLVVDIIIVDIINVIIIDITDVKFVDMLWIVPDDDVIIS